MDGIWQAMDAVRKPPSLGGSKSFAAFQEQAKNKASDDFVSGWLNQVDSIVPASLAHDMTPRGWQVGWARAGLDRFAQY
jgi:hypothetical protein